MTQQGPNSGHDSDREGLRRRKERLRERMLARRRSMTEEEVRIASTAAQRRLLGTPQWHTARAVLLYMACRNELRTEMLLHELLQTGGRALMPRCCRAPADAPGGGPGALTGELELVEITHESQLAPGAFGIQEPDPCVCAAATDLEVDLAVLPGLAFDIRGRRLGQGGGYYDRLLATGRLQGATLVGLCHAWQLVQDLPREPWDKNVHAVCTDRELLWI